MRRTQPTTRNAKISSTNHVQMLQWLHGKQQQHKNIWGWLVTKTLWTLGSMKRIPIFEWALKMVYFDFINLSGKNHLLDINSSTQDKIEKTTHLSIHVTANIVPRWHFICKYFHRYIKKLFKKDKKNIYLTETLRRWKKLYIYMHSIIVYGSVKQKKL